MNLKKLFYSLLSVVLAIIIIALIYVAYVFIAYHRVPDHQALEVENPVSEQVKENTTYTIMSYNIGFGAYEPDFGFFMDGGTESWAFSKERLNANMANIAAFVKKENADLYLFQEVDRDSTRTYHMDEQAFLRGELIGYTSVMAENWDSPFLFYPFTQPHGKSVSGIMTFSRFGIESSLRRSLPVEDTLKKLVDLDRCYSISRIPVEGGKYLVVVNLHLSAYTTDGKIAEDQIEMLVADMQAEYDKGNYVICGGDFNKDLLGNSDEIFGVDGEEYTWAQPFPVKFLEGTCFTLCAPLDENAPVPSCRNADGPYHPEQFVVTLDGFIVSDNVKVENLHVVDTGFAYSDHNPVEMQITLIPDAK